MIEQLSHVFKNVHIMNNEKLVKHLWAELHAVSKSEIDLEIFNSEKDVIDLNISVLTEWVFKTAFKLWVLLSSLMKSLYISSQHDTLTACKDSMMMICSILTHNQASRKSNNLSMLLELYLHSMRIKQHIINLLAELDIISSYQTINEKCAELAEIKKVSILSCIFFSKII